MGSGSYGCHNAANVDSRKPSGAKFGQRRQVRWGVALGNPALMKEAAEMDGQPVVADLLGNAPEWQERALCSQTDPEAFFPEKGGSTREAKRICSRCDVKGECLEYALGHDERFGIWGGLSERERRRLKRRVA